MYNRVLYFSLITESVHVNGTCFLLQIEGLNLVDGERKKDIHLSTS